MQREGARGFKRLVGWGCRKSPHHPRRYLPRSRGGASDGHRGDLRKLRWGLGVRVWCVVAAIIAANHLHAPAAACLSAEGGQATGTGVICGS
jgi:hypothetical protein